MKRVGWRSALALVIAFLLLNAARICAEEPARTSLKKVLIFYAPLDEHARGILVARQAGIEGSVQFVKAPGKIGAALRVPAGTGVSFPVEKFLSNEEGTLAGWVKVDWDPAEKATHNLLSLGKFGQLYRWTDQ